MSECNLELCCGKEGVDFYSNASLSHEESICIALVSANNMAYECITLFLLTPCLLNRGNRAGRNSRSHPCPEAGSAATVLADRLHLCQDS